MDIFIDVLFNQKYERLIRFGSAGYSDILKAWEQIYSEFCDLSDNINYKILISDSKTLGAIESRILTLETCKYVLGFRSSVECQGVLKQFGITEPDRHKIIPLIDVKLKFLYADRDSRLKEFEKQKEQAEKNQYSQADFEKILAKMTKFYGSHINTRMLNVSEFCAHINLMKNHK